MVKRNQTDGIGTRRIIEELQQEYDSVEVVRSDRKTIALQLKDGGRTLIIRCNRRDTEQDIRRVVQNNKTWLKKAGERLREKEKIYNEDGKKLQPLTVEEIRKLGEQACDVFPKRTAAYAARIGVSYGRITIRNQKTRWGSCSSKGNLNFNCLLMLAPVFVQDYVIIHELCHLLEMNHSHRFWALVSTYCPDYERAKQWLASEGMILIRRMTVNGR